MRRCCQNDCRRSGTRLALDGGASCRWPGLVFFEALVANFFDSRTDLRLNSQKDPLERFMLKGLKVTESPQSIVHNQEWRRRNRTLHRTAESASGKQRPLARDAAGSKPRYSMCRRWHFKIASDPDFAVRWLKAQLYEMHRPAYRMRLHHFRRRNATSSFQGQAQENGGRLQFDAQSPRSSPPL